MTESDDGSPAVSADAEPEAGTTPDPEPGETVAVVEPKSARRPTLRFSVAIAVAVLALDQLSKRWALRSLSDGQSRHVIWTWHWNLTFNSGMAFSRAQGVGPYIGAVAFIVIIVMLLSVRRNGGVVSSIAVGLVVGGAVGNLSDRLFREQGWLRGRVIDFIDFRWWPIFNVADMGVTIGGALLLLAALFDSRRAGTGSPR